MEVERVISPKTLEPEKVLLFERRVEEAVESVAQPKRLEDQVRKEPAWQVTRPKPPTLVPKRLVVEAVVEKKLVEVALVVVLWLAIKPPVKVEEAVEMKPWKNPRVVEVETPQVGS